MSKVSIEKVQNLIQYVAETEILPHFCSLESEDIARKQGGSLVTKADKAAEKALSRGLCDLLPTSTVVGEEAFALNPGILRRFSDDNPVWIVDPIDGTANFVGKKPLFGVIISLVERNQVVAGWLYDPFSKDFVMAEKGAGAYCGDKKLKVLPPTSLDKMGGVLSPKVMECYNRAISLPHPEDTLFEKPVFHERTHAICHEYARLVVDAPLFGSPGPQWHFHGMFFHSTPWDCAAGVLIHEESGGYAAHSEGVPYTPSSYNDDLLLAPDVESWRELEWWTRRICPPEARR